MDHRPGKGSQKWLPSMSVVALLAAALLVVAYGWYAAEREGDVYRRAMLAYEAIVESGVSVEKLRVRAETDSVFRPEIEGEVGNEKARQDLRDALVSKLGTEKRAFAFYVRVRE